METLGQRLRHARLAKGLTQDEIADALGIKRVNISYWESDKYGPARDRVAIIADLLGVTEGWLLTGEGTAPAIPRRASLINQATELFARLSPEDQERELAYLRSKLDPPTE